MIWLVWRQHCGQLLFVLAGLAAIAAVVVFLGLGMHRGFQASGLADCLAGLHPSALTEGAPADPDAMHCAQLAADFRLEYGPRSLAGILLTLVPLLIGVAVGTQLVADDVDHGTHRLVWTQSVTRRRWTAAKLGLVCAVAAVAAAAYGLLGYWFLTPIARSGVGRLPMSDLLGLTPAAHALFAVALGAFTGAVWRKVPPAIAATLIGFVAARLAVRAARPNFLPPLERTLPVQWNPAEIELGRPYRLTLSGDWDIGGSGYDATGQLMTNGGMSFCPSPVPSPPNFANMICTNPDIPVPAYNVFIFQPDSRFWMFQLIEIGIFLVLAAALIALTVRRIDRLT